MSLEYYQHVRSEIAPLLPVKAERILEIGCGAGATLGWLRGRYPGAHLAGVEGFASNEPHIAKVADQAIIADLNSGVPNVGQFDLILALDVLEHLLDADRILAQLASMLAPGGAIIVSLPNIAHYSVSASLLLKRQFAYADEGILDRTHLRFFEESSILALMNKAGLSITQGLAAGLNGPKSRLLDTATLGLFRHWLTKQYIVRGEHGAGQQPVKWRVA